MHKEITPSNYSLVVDNYDMISDLAGRMWSSRVYKFNLSLDKSAMEDYKQQVFTKLLVTKSVYNSKKGSFRKYISIIAYTTLMDCFRRQQCFYTKHILLSDIKCNSPHTDDATYTIDEDEDNTSHLLETLYEKPIFAEPRYHLPENTSESYS